MEAEKYKVNLYIESTIHAPQRGEGRAMWLVEYSKAPDQIITRQGFTEFGETTEEAITLTTLIEALSILHKRCEIRINTKARSVFYTIKQRKNAGWRDRKWLSAPAKSTKNAHLWELATHFMEQHDCTVCMETHTFEIYMESELEKWQRALSRQEREK